MDKEIVLELMDLLEIKQVKKLIPLHKVMIIGAVKEAIDKAKKYDELKRLLS